MVPWKVQASLTRLDLSGNVGWTQRLTDGSRATSSVGIDVDGEGNIILGGTSGVVANQYDDWQSPRFLAASYNASGGMKWWQTYSAGSGPYQQLFGVASGSGIYMTGSVGDGGIILHCTVGATPPPGQESGVYPNPPKGDEVNLTLRLKANAEELDVQVYNTAMELVFRGVWHNVPMSSGIVKITGLNRLAPGRYLVKAKALLSGGKVQVFPAAKMVVKR